MSSDLHMEFKRLPRQKFREYFQPSRVVIAIVEDGERSEFNLTTLCFCMHAGYKPASMAISVEKRHWAHDLLLRRTRFVLAVPGPTLAHATLFCGLNSGRDTDKASVLGLRLERSARPETAWLMEALANIELVKSGMIDAGDHDVFIGRVEGDFVNNEAAGPGLLSVGTSHSGYRILAQSGIHRIAVPSDADLQEHG